MTGGPTSIPATARAVETDGTKTLSLWVANDSWVSCVGGPPSCAINLVTQPMVDAVADAFLLSSAGNDVYDWVTSVFGDEWGPHGFGNLIPPTNEIHILMYDIDNDDSTNGGILGFYWAKDCRGPRTGSCEGVGFSVCYN